MNTSPNLRDMLAPCHGQVIVRPTTEEKVIRVAAVCARYRVKPGMPRLTSVGLAPIGAVVAELVAGAGLAQQTLQSNDQLNIPKMFVALVLISVTVVAHVLGVKAPPLRPCSVRKIPTQTSLPNPPQSMVPTGSN